MSDGKAETETEGYAFDDGIPLNEIDRGTTVFVAGEAFSAAEDVALSMVLSGADSGDGMVFISNASRTDELLEDFDRLKPGVDTERMAIVDSTGHRQSEDRDDLSVERVSNSGDLTGIGMKFSSLYADLLDGDEPRVRTAFVNVSRLLMYADLRTVFRFLHTIDGRTSGTGGLLVLAVNPSAVDERSLSTLMQLCDGRIDVRTTDGQLELQVNGLGRQSNGWLPVRLGDGAE